MRSLQLDATLQTPHSPHIQYLPSYLLVYLYSAPPVWFYSALDTALPLTERWQTGTQQDRRPVRHPSQ
jgi:hypothetical protein